MGRKHATDNGDHLDHYRKPYMGEFYRQKSPYEYLIECNWYFIGSFKYLML